MSDDDIVMLERAMAARAKALEALGALSDFDPEIAHDQADGILLTVLRAHGLGDVADAWQAACARVGFWYA